MNANATVNDLEPELPSLDVELLSEAELRAIEGGLVYMPALYLLAGAGIAAFLGMAVGAGIYYITR